MFTLFRKKRLTLLSSLALLSSTLLADLSPVKEEGLGMEFNLAKRWALVTADDNRLGLIGYNLDGYFYYQWAQSNFKLALGPDLQINWAEEHLDNSKKNFDFASVSLGAKVLASYKVSIAEPFAYLEYSYGSAAFQARDKNDNDKIKGTAKGFEYGLGTRIFVSSTQAFSIFYAMEHGKLTSLKATNHNNDIPELTVRASKLGVGFSFLL